MSIGDRYTPVRIHFRELLIDLRDRLRLFIEVLGKQKDALGREDLAAVRTYLEQEENILEGILAFRQPVESWNALYQPSQDPNPEEIRKLKADIKTLGRQAKAQSEENQRFLAQRMTIVNAEIQGLKKYRPRNPAGVYHTGSVDITL